MPAWKIKGYYCYFKVGEVTEEHKGIHVHVETSHGSISFWIKENSKKSKYEVKVKQVEGRVSDYEENKVKKIIEENIELFVEEWKKRSLTF